MVNQSQILNMNNFIKITGIPELKDFSINRSGALRNDLSMKIFKPELSKKFNTWKYRIIIPINETPVQITFNSAKLLLYVFIDSFGLNYREIDQNIVPGFKNENKLDISLDNLYWSSLKEVHQKQWAERKRMCDLKYPYPINSDKILNEVPNLPGFYFFPWKEARRAINRDGVVYDLLRDQLAKIHNSAAGYPSLNVTMPNNEVELLTVHRIAAELFVDKPPRHVEKELSELHVNHINGIKTDNRSNNLEWCTNEENIEHSLVFLNPELRFAVKRKNIETGEETTYSSILEASEISFIPYARLHKHLYSKLAGKISHQGFAYKFDNDEDWPSLINTEESVPRNHPLVDCKIGYSYDVIGENIVTGEIFIFSNLNQACSILGLSSGSLYFHRDKYGDKKPYYDWIFYALNGQSIAKRRKAEKK